MPTITSQRTGPAPRRARRRQRHREKKISTKFPHRQRNYRRSMPKRQLHKQPSDIDDCFEECQEFGFRLDPDVHVGNDAAQHNHFSILDTEYSSYSTPDPIPTPYQDHTIRPPQPFLAELEWQVAKKSYPKLQDVEPPTLPEPEAYQQPLAPPPRKSWWRAPCLVDDIEANRCTVKIPPSATTVTVPPSVETRSTLTTLPSAPSVRLPDSLHPLPLPPAKRRKLNDAPAPSFLTTYRIPSPLLYHKPSRDTLPNIDAESFCFCLGPSSQHTNCEHPGLFDPQSNRICCVPPEADPAPEPTRPLLQTECRFVASALPNKGVATPSSPVEQAILVSDHDFYTNTRPYLLPRKSTATSKTDTDNSTPSMQKSTPAITKAKKLTTNLRTSEDVRSTDAPLLATDSASKVPPTMTHGMTTQDDQPVSRNNELIFPRLSASAFCRDMALDRYLERTINFWSKQQDDKRKETPRPTTLDNDTVDYVEDRKCRFEALWEAYEKAVLGPKEQPHTPSPPWAKFPIVGLPGPSKGRKLCPVPMNPAKSTPVDIKIPQDIDPSSRSLLSCKELVPARLYEKQYLGLMRRWNSDICNLEQRPPPTTNTIIKQIQDTETQGKIQQAVDWLTEDLEFGEMFTEEIEDGEPEESWFQPGWDKHLLFPKNDASSVSLPVSPPFEDAELYDDKGTPGSDMNNGTHINEDSDGEQWLEWDDVVDGSTWSEDEFSEW